MRLVSGAAVALAALATASAASADTTRKASTSSYTLTLGVGPNEPMYTTAQVKAKHPTTGEVMVAGSMGTGGMAMGGSSRHLEVHIRAKATGKLIGSPLPTISLTDTSGMAMTPTKLAVAAMEGIGEGAADIHFGNNVSLIKNHIYKVVVTVKGESATFTFKAA